VSSPAICTPPSAGVDKVDISALWPGCGRTPGIDYAPRGGSERQRQTWQRVMDERCIGSRRRHGQRGEILQQDEKSSVVVSVVCRWSEGRDERALLRPRWSLTADDQRLSRTVICKPTLTGRAFSIYASVPLYKPASV